jgi:tight adherence protein C
MPSQLAKRLASFVPRSPKEMGRLQKRLAKAGIHGYLPAAIFVFMELALPIVLGGAVLFFMGLRTGIVLGLIAGGVGYLLPGLWLNHATANRMKLIQNGLPDALDLFIVCLEAGSALDQAIVKATDELALAHPQLTEELRMITSEIRAGKPRIEAFKNFATRTNVDDVRALVAMLVQTDRFGTSVAQALRTHAEVSRTKRRQRAEERAAKVGVKLVFPLVFLLFPAFYVVTLGPAVIQFVRVFFGEVMAR